LKNIDYLEQERVDSLNAKITNTMQELLSIPNVNCNWTEPDEWTIYVDVTFTTDFKNNSSKTIDKFITSLTLYDSSGNKETDINFDESKIIKPNSVVKIKINKEFDLYDSNDKKVLDSLQKGGGTYYVKYTYIHFTDGSELKLHTKFE
jgi:hypothetical protein